MVAEGTQAAKGLLVKVVYDPAVLTYQGFLLGNLLPPPPTSFPLSPPAREREDGLSVVEGGATMLGAGVVHETTGGVLGTFTFDVAAEMNRVFPGVGPFWGNGLGRDIPDLPRKGRARTFRWGAERKRPHP